MVTMATIALAGLLTPVVVATLGARGALVATGLLLPLLVLATAAPLRALDRATREPPSKLALLRALPLLAPLPSAAVERLARPRSATARRAGRDASWSRASREIASTRLPAERST